MDKKTVTIISIILALLCIGGISVFFIMKTLSIPDPVVNICINGELYRTEPLSVDCEFTVATELGSNTVCIQNGAVAVTYADCPDKVCIHSGSISGGSVPIICLPHRLEIRIVSAEDDSADVQIK
ncbi:MAG: NusG domain II-containing protein [Oscillospiraceae bacterium]|nr:NusG domain II-containing protein [Oscillospiraceae bacterium]